ncbi:hypothetical protein K443DRAFT_377248 [Laccaria amethystina LaAM-08-1]|uniref:Uncharacterized protein n=1 Tax=Laccaria amethystina LaAM-08-1 TaxID=1095629 RepID=A0A0C9WJ02_9AGAR|nr:hypothetical protein K443DRAFT_377248 [Laccaria amethystina LaAM-08-1]
MIETIRMTYLSQFPGYACRSIRVLQGFFSPHASPGDTTCTAFRQPFALVHRITSFSEDLFYLYCRFFGMRRAFAAEVANKSTTNTTCRVLY